MTTKIEDIILEAEREGGADFIPLISDGDDSFEFKEGENESLPLLALRNMVLFPGVVMPVTLGREKSLKAVRNAYKKGVVIGLIGLMGLVGCQEVSLEQQAAEAAQSYYQRLLDGYPDGFLAGKAAYDEMPADYRDQLVKANEQYMKDVEQKHNGLRSVVVSPNVGRIDSTLHVVYAFLLLSYGDSTKEEVTVPMVQVDGDWKMR